MSHRPAPLPPPKGCTGYINDGEVCHDGEPCPVHPDGDAPWHEDE